MRTKLLVLAALGTTACTAGAAIGAASSAAAPRVVGTVTAAGGADLWVKRAAGGSLATVTVGTALYLHDIIAAGPGAHVDVRLDHADASLAAGDDVLYVDKLLTAARPAAAAVGKEFGIAAPAVARHSRLAVSRAGALISITLSP